MKIIDAKHEQIGGEISGIDINKIEAGDPVLEDILDAIYRNRLIVLRGQDFTPAQYVDFTRKLGTPQIYLQENYHHPDFPEIFVSSNVNKFGEKIGVARTGHYWHTDCQFQTHPLSFTSITPIILPESIRATYYIDMHKLYTQMPDDLMALVEGKTLIHGGKNRYKVRAEDLDKSIQELIDNMNEMVPPVKHPAIIEHPVTGEKSLYVMPSVGMGGDMDRSELSEDEFSSVIEEYVSTVCNY
uniref:Taurine dioxygenase n=1 Tax=Candidatus Kentrum sp. TUN TaxID=2126343 RepID=A0A450ZA80_9GAMM|nr:MAG: taurine dioxygenase [Candidatus Kentron sp. TUN]